VSEVRGRPFQPGNKHGKGRPPGSRNKSTMLFQEMLDEHGAAVLRKTMFMALQGNIAAIRLWVERLLPSRRNSPVKLKLPPVDSAADVTNAVSQVLRAVRNGKISAAEGDLYISMYNKARETFEAEDLAKRIDALERQQAIR